MKLTFIRADHEVTGSCTLLEIGGHYGLIDCGMEQGRDLFENIAIPVPAAQIEFVLVTHAHMDHTGHLPLLYKQGFRGTVYATEATCDLCGIMLRDGLVPFADCVSTAQGQNRLSAVGAVIGIGAALICMLLMAYLCYVFVPTDARPIRVLLYTILCFVPIFFLESGVGRD